MKNNVFSSDVNKPGRIAAISIAVISFALAGKKYRKINQVNYFLKLKFPFML
jgi:hypothetical protein